MSGASAGIMMCSLPETSSDGGGRSPSEEFQTAQETLFLSSQELTVNLSGRVVNDHYKELKASVDVSTEFVKTVDLGKDSDPGFSQKTFRGILDLQSMRVDDAAEQSGDSTLGKNVGLLKPKFGEIISLKCGEVTGEITVGNSKEESPAKNRKESKDYQIGAMNTAHGILTSPLKAMDKDPEMDIPKETEVRSNEERGSSKKTSKGQSILETSLEEFQTAQETLQINSQEQTMNSPGRVVEDHHCDVSTEHIETIDLGKDSGDPGFWGACVDNVAKTIDNSALGKTIGLFKQKIEESVSLQCRGPAGEIVVGNLKEESLQKRESGLGTTNLVQ
ncbi:uncharacterized protein LOC122082528 [Macadamia integrifolia]|uniref:uncharacterized protein LOC122082528 n=1 Tax=Macadamia integrifolia TaxID=60698 RepID=UPI001C4E3A9B|nr:uncharacterized protein LOC122082528 [Macadamia integrifolia]